MKKLIICILLISAAMSCLACEGIFGCDHHFDAEDQTSSTTTTTTAPTTKPTTTMPKNTTTPPEKPAPVPVQTNGKYLFFDDLRTKDYITNITLYQSTLSWNYVEYSGNDNYQEAILTVQLDFYCEELEKDGAEPFLGSKNSVSFHCEFYRFDGELSDLRYEFYDIELSNLKFNRVIYIFKGELLIGQALYFVNSAATVTDAWLEDFLNDSLIAINLDYQK